MAVEWTEEQLQIIGHRGGHGRIQARSLTLLLAPHFGEVVGVDADADMLSEATRLAEEKRVGNVSWRQMRAEELPADLPAVRVGSFAQSFHWMDRRRVAAAVRRLLDTDGALVHVSAMTHQGVETESELPHPQPPRQEIALLVRRYLGLQQRAGHGVLSAGTPEGEEAIYRAAGFSGPQHLEVPGGWWSAAPRRSPRRSTRCPAQPPASSPTALGTSTPSCTIC